jgi:DNA polymerase-3 subunit gamma/tau
LQEATVRQMLGAVDRSHVFALIDALARGDGQTVVQTVDALRYNGLSGASTLEEMAGVLQRMAVAQAVPALAGDDASDPEVQAIAALAQALPADETQLLYSLCLHGRAELGLAPDEYAGLTMVLLRLLAFKSPIERAVRQPGEAEKKSLKPADTPAPAPVPAVPPLAPPPPSAAPQPVPAPRPQLQPEPEPEPPAMAPSPVAPVPAPATTALAESDHWFELVMDMVQRELVTALVRELALQSQLLAREGGTWRLRVERETLNQASTRDRLQTALAAAGHSVTLQVEVGVVNDSAARRLAAKAAARQLEAEAAMAADPFVQQMLNEFGGKIVPGSLKPL